MKTGLYTKLILKVIAGCLLITVIRGYSFLELPVNIKDIEMHVDIKSASTRDEMNVKVSGSY